MQNYGRFQLSTYYRCERSARLSITLQAIAKVPVGIFAQFSFVSFNKRTALCEADTEFDNNNTLETATLTFYSSEELPTGNLCFV